MEGGRFLIVMYFSFRVMKRSCHDDRARWKEAKGGRGGSVIMVMLRGNYNACGSSYLVVGDEDG